MTALWRKAEYIFRPSQLGRRLRRALLSKIPEVAEETLPWGLRLRYHPGESIGASIWRMGVYDLPVTEAIWRLADAGETVLDVGANIGYMTSVLAARVGAKGRVIAFEPHPELFSELSGNIGSWSNPLGGQPVVAHQLALSARAGTASLAATAEFTNNRGTASLETVEGCQSSWVVTTNTLSEVVGNEVAIGLMKIDVEGHELQVLHGASALLGEHRIRDIVFEEHLPWPSPVTNFLSSHGYHVLTLERSVFGLRVRSGGPREGRSHTFDACSYLATIQPARAVERLSGKGWRALWGS